MGDEARLLEEIKKREAMLIKQIGPRGISDDVVPLMLDFVRLCQEASQSLSDYAALREVQDIAQHWQLMMLRSREPPLPTVKRRALSKEEFEKAIQENADLSNALVQGGDFRGIALENENLSDAILLRNDFTEARLKGAVLWRAILDWCALVGAHLDDVTANHSSLIGADLTRAFLTKGKFVGATLDSALLDGAYLDGAVFDGASFAAARLIGVTAETAPVSFRGARLTTANLSGAKIPRADFSNGER